MYIIIFLVVCVWAWRLKKKNYNLPPMAVGSLPIVGHSFSILIDHKNLYKLVINMYRNAMQQQLEAVTFRIGATDLYVVLDIDDGLLISNSCLKKDHLYDLFQPWFGKEGLITAPEAIWRRHRKLLNPAFNQRILDGFLIEMNYQSRLLVQNLKQHVGKGPFDHASLIENTTLHTICATAMGASIDEEDKMLKNMYLKRCKEFSKGMIERGQKFWLHNDFIYGLSALKKKQQRLADEMKQLSNKVIQKRRRIIESNNSTINDTSKHRYKAFLDILLELSREGAFTDSEIREEVDTFIAAGFDTTAMSISLILCNIGSYAKVQEKVFEELDEVFGRSDRDVEKQDLPRLKYLEAVIKETLRLYPIVLASGRVLEQDVALKNYTLPAGSRCYISFYSFLRHPVWGEDRDQFNPDRWLDVSRLPANLNFYAVFGLGKRSCIGGNYSLMSIKTNLAHILRHYRVSGDILRVEFKMEVTVKPAAGHFIQIQDRK